MGGFELFCSVSGANHEIESVAETIYYDAFGGTHSDSDEDPEDTTTDVDARLVKEIARTFLPELKYHQEDIEAAKDFVLICPYSTREDGSITLNPNKSLNYDPAFTEVYNIVPGDDTERGRYKSIDPADRTRYSSINYGSSVLVSYSSYVILRHVVPGLQPSTLHSLVKDGPVYYSGGRIAGVDYGPVGGTISQYPEWSNICEPAASEDRDAGTFWRKLLLQCKDKSKEEILQEAWYGRGNMWVFKRPDRFPIAETLAADALPAFPLDDSESPTLENSHSSRFTFLPVDILLHICEFLTIRDVYALVSTCKILRAGILPHSNSIAYTKLRANEPWYLPARALDIPKRVIHPGDDYDPDDDDHHHHHKSKAPDKLKAGREEMDYWEKEWAKGGFEEGDVYSATADVPWFGYRKACSSSLSMWNRRRIWGIAKQIEVLANERDLL